MEIENASLAVVIPTWEAVLHRSGMVTLTFDLPQGLHPGMPSAADPMFSDDARAHGFGYVLVVFADGTPVLLANAQEETLQDLKSAPQVRVVARTQDNSGTSPVRCLNGLQPLPIHP